MFWKKDEMDFILPFQKIIDGDIILSLIGSAMKKKGELKK